MTKDGVVDRASYDQLVDDTVAIASVMWVNNEIGTVQPIAELALRAKTAGALFHTDAVQAFGKVEIDAKKIPFDFLTISGHKIGAPKGVGAAFVRRGTSIEPLFHGGSQDRGTGPGAGHLARRQRQPGGIGGHGDGNHAGPQRQARVHADPAQQRGIEPASGQQHHGDEGDAARGGDHGMTVKTNLPVRRWVSRPTLCQVTV